MSCNGSAYVFRDGAGGWRQTAKLIKASPIGISGGTVVVDSASRAYVFQQNADGWRQTAKLAVSGSTAHHSGSLVAVSDGTVLVGGAGPAYVFQDGAAGWRQTAKLTGSDRALDHALAAESLALSGSTAVVGVSFPVSEDVAGRAYVFQRNGQGWRQTAALAGSGTDKSDFGGSVAVSGRTAVLGVADGASMLQG